MPTFSSSVSASSLPERRIHQRLMRKGIKQRASPANMNAVWTAGCLNMSGRPLASWPTTTLSCNLVAMVLIEPVKSMQVARNTTGSLMIANQQPIPVKRDGGCWAPAPFRAGAAQPCGQLLQM